MVGVQNHGEKCPKCKGNYGFYELETRTQEEYFMCERCGYSYENKISNWEEIKGKKRTEAKAKYKVKESDGFGCYRILFGGGGSVGVFTDKKGAESFEESFKKENGFKNKEGKIADEVYYTFKKNGKWWIKDLVNDTEYLFVKKEIMDNLM